MAHMMHREATLGSSSLRQRFLTPVNLTSMSKRGASQRPVTAFASGDAVLHRGFCVPQKQILQRPRRIDQGVRGSKLVAKAAESSPFPFNESNYHRVTFLNDPWGPLKIYQDPRNNHQFTGVMVFKRSVDMHLTDETKILEVFVAGDTAVNIFTLVNDQKLERPMVHDTMFSIMQKAQSENPRRWALLKVAIVALQNDVFVGRLFFGDPLTGCVHWDCDCRPSDGCFLSIKCNAALFVHENVWDAAAKLVQDSTVYQMLQEAQRLAEMQSEVTSSTATTIVPSSNAVQQQQLQAAVVSSSNDSNQQTYSTDYLVLMDDDMEAIKLLKRKMSLAVTEEDYGMAAKIRDHPYMMLYKELHSNRLLGKASNAAQVEMKLKRLVENNTMWLDPSV